MHSSNTAPRNRTLSLTEADRIYYGTRLATLDSPVQPDRLRNVTIHADLFMVLDFLPPAFADLIFLDPPYNLNKDFHGQKFSARSLWQYQDWLESWLPAVVRCLRPGGSLYLCGDWKSAGPIHFVLDKYLTLRNRITFEREKGRGARTNWKNCSEDIWFATRGEAYTFNVDEVKLRRRVIAPYRDASGGPKDWEVRDNGRFRDTHPSNLWTDITIPFWSMPENTPHPTQKPEKLLAKLILASSNKGDLVFDPFLGAGTTSVVAWKLGRRYCGIEVIREYCLLAEKRLALSHLDRRIQGYAGGIFWDRNTHGQQQLAVPPPPGRRRSEPLKRIGSNSQAGMTPVVDG